MRRVLKVLAALAVMLAGAVAAVAIHRVQGEKDVPGSSTVEFVATTTTETQQLPTNIRFVGSTFNGRPGNILADEQLRIAIQKGINRQAITQAQIGRIGISARRGTSCPSSRRTSSGPACGP